MTACSQLVGGLDVGEESSKDSCGFCDSFIVFTEEACVTSVNIVNESIEVDLMKLARVHYKHQIANFTKFYKIQRKKSIQ